METGFLNPIHDEEHFTSSIYTQGSGLEDSEHLLFGELIVPEVIDYENFWQSDDTGPPSEPGEAGTRKEDFQRLLFEWQHQLNYMQEPEVIKQIIVPVAEKTTQEVSDMFANRTSTSSVPTAPSIDELFPLETNKETSTVDTYESNRENVSNEKEVDIPIQIKLEKPQDEVEEEVEEVVRVKQEKEDFTVDVETVDEETPLLMAGDLTSLLEQFEATEKVNAVPSSPRPSSKNIRDALPAEVINKIRATRENHKKMISVIPAMPNKRPGRAATRMQDAGATLSRNKFLKLVTGGSSGESVQLDHDYCTSGDTSSSSRSYYMSDSSEYPSQSSTPDAMYSRLPDYYLALAPQKGNTQATVADSGSRKDSGLESGENSEEDVHSVSEMKSKVVLKSVSGLKSINIVTENGVVIGSAPVVQNKVPMVSLLKKNNIKIEKEEKAVDSSAPSEVMSVASSTQVGVIDTQQVSKKKKKLNLEEYRVRREERERFRSQESSRASSPVSCGTPLAQPDSTTASQESVPKEKPVMHSVEVQTQTCDFIDLTKEQEKSRMDRKDKRSDLKHRSYRSRHASSSSSSSSGHSDRRRSHSRSHRRKRRSRSNKHRKSSVSRMWSRSPSRSSSRSHSAVSSRSRSRSKSHDRRQKWRSRSPRKSNNRYSNNNKGFHSRDNRDRAWHRVRSPVRVASRNPDFGTQEKVRQVEERRVIYVGRIDEGTSKAELRKRFQNFGPIVDISVHFRERGDNYGFVTFAYKADAYKAVEHGNDDPKLPRYDLCFGGRRAFCKQRYADLDGMATNNHSQFSGPMPPQPHTNESFDLLLHEVKAQLRKRSSV